MKKIVVTGGSGKAGRAVVKNLLEHDYSVLNVDIQPPAEKISPFLQADLTELGQAYDVLENADAVVHLAAIRAPGLQPSGVTFDVNIKSTYNIFSAGIALGLKRIVWASSETTIGLPFDREQPAYAPIDDFHPLYPESTYALSKILMEEMARQMNRWSGVPIIGLRFSNIMEPQDYQRFPSFWKDATLRKWNLWGYVDARDVAQSCRRALEADFTGADHFMIAAGDTCMNRPNSELMAEVFPDVELRKVGDYDTLLSVDRAREILGYNPEYSWRNHLEA